MDEIIPNLWLGDMEDGKRVSGTPEYHPICVLESWTGVPIRAWVPLLGTAPNGQVLRERLDMVANFINVILRSGNKCLVFCGAGIERSPLAVAWFLRKYSYATDLNEAYKMIVAKRPQVQDRQAWIAHE